MQNKMGFQNENHANRGNEDEHSIEPAVLRLLSRTFKLREDFGLRVTNARIIRIVDENDCRLRIFHELTYPRYESNVDPQFRKRHDFVRDKIASKITSEFGATHQIHVEYGIITGRLDIGIVAKKDCSLNPKIVGIEVKTGKSFNLSQSLRYLYKCESVVVVRLVNRQVRILQQEEHKDMLLDNISSNIEKIDHIMDHNLDKRPGEACQGCPVSHCEHRKPSKWANCTPARAPSDEPVISTSAIREIL